MTVRALSFLCAAALPLPARGQDPMPSPDACRALLGTLDRAFNAGDADGYLRLFAVEQPMLHDLHGREVRQRLAVRPPLRRHSEAGTPRRVGNHVVVPVVYETTAPARAGIPGGACVPLRERGAVVARNDHGRLVPVLAVALPQSAWSDDDVFQCPPCNFRMGGADGWLCVPIAHERTMALDGASFLLLGTDVALELSVQLGDNAEPAAAIACEIAHELAQPIADAVVGDTEPWQPPSVPAGLPDLSAARTTIDLPDGQRVVVHTVALGRLHHLLLLRGAKVALLAQQPAIAALLQTYRLLHTDSKVALQAATALREHTGGALHGADYQNERHGVAAAGPEGWHAVQHCGGALFQVAWTCGHQAGRMWLTGYAPPGGFAEWTTALADRFLLDLSQRAAIPLHNAVDSDWSPVDQDGVRKRTLVVPPQPGAAPDQPAANDRRLQLWLRPELLVVTDGYTSEAAQQEMLQRAIASVRRL